MTFSLLQVSADSNHWGAIWPELSVGCLALALLVLEILLPKKAHGCIPTVAILGQLAVLARILYHFHWGNFQPAIFNGLLWLTPLTQSMRVFFLLASIMTCVLARVSLARQSVPHVEFYCVLLAVTGAMMLLVESHHFVMLFVALETLTVGFYILVSYFRKSALTLEAGLKYLVMGALSSALLLFGIVLLYGVAGNPSLPGFTAEGMDYKGLGLFLEANPHNYLAGVGIALVLSGLAFKVGAFPFQFWIPDVYQGAPTPVTAFLAVASKGAGIMVLLILAETVFTSYAWLVIPVLGFLAAATILFGNLAALSQPNVKRLIGLSGVSHAGFMLLGVVAGLRASPDVGAMIFSRGAVLVYLFAYLLASFAVFGVMVHVAGPDDADQQLGHYAGLAKDSPFLAAILAIGLGSLAGIPPLAGFLGKFLVFVAAFQARLYWLLAVAVIGVVLSIYYYFGWIRAAFFEPAGQNRPERTPAGLAARASLAAIALCSVLLVFFQGPLGRWLGWRP
jgi:NADH-quinone oxidoreductase subunit N